MFKRKKCVVFSKLMCEAENVLIVVQIQVSGPDKCLIIKFNLTSNTRRFASELVYAGTSIRVHAVSARASIPGARAQNGESPSLRCSDSDGSGWKR